MKRFGYDVRKITTENGRRCYQFSDGSRALTGIDVSHHVGHVDWDLVREDGISFAIMRAGGRKLATGELYMDELFFENTAGATGAGIPVGAYFCGSAISREEMIEETEYLLDILKGQPITWPVVMDIEVPKPEWRTYSMGSKLRTELALIFLEKISASGYQPMLYCNSIPGMQTLVDLLQLEDMDKWIAEYRFKPYYPYDFGIWQYSCTASIKGISQEGDLDLAFVDYGACNFRY